MSKAERTKALEIPPRVKKAVYERDGGACVWCGKQGQPNAHYIPRSHSGLGIEENILTLCWDCHLRYDQTTNREEMRTFFKTYLKSKYTNWDEKKLIYKKGL
jgi:5-methylcytosine-specific restriction endonuclease McrA